MSVVYILLTSHSLLNSFQSGLDAPPKQLLLRLPIPEMTINPDLILLDFSAAVDSGDWPLFPSKLSLPFGFIDICVLVFLTALCCFSALLLNSSFLYAWPSNVEAIQNLVLKAHFSSHSIFFLEVIFPHSWLPLCIVPEDAIYTKICVNSSPLKLYSSWLLQA